MLLHFCRLFRCALPSVVLSVLPGPSSVDVCRMLWWCMESEFDVLCRSEIFGWIQASSFKYTRESSRRR